MKILQVANGYPPLGLGGVEVYTHDLAQGLMQRGHTLTVFCHHSDLALPDYHLERARIGSIDVVRVVNDHKQSVSFRDTFIDPQIETIFKDFLLETRPDVIHFNHLIGLSARLPLIAEELGIPFIVTLHDYWPICHQIRLVNARGRPCPGPQNGVSCAECIGGAPRSAQQRAALRWLKTALSPRLRRRVRELVFRGKSLETQPSALALEPGDLEMRAALFKRVLLAARAILVPSEYVRSRYAQNGYPAERIDVLPLGINITPSPNALERESGPLIFAAAGAVIPAKGFHTLVRAFRSTSGENLRLHLYGRTDLDANYTRELKRLAAEDGRIEFKGAFPPDQRAAIYRSIDVLVQPSAFPETFSLAAREALACGKPVVAARIGALPEVVTEGVNGYLFEPENDGELAVILAAIAADPTRLTRLELPGPIELLSVAEHTRRVEVFYSS